MKKREIRTLAEINVTSLVDVTLVLLIIFIITAPLLQGGIEVNLPKTTAVSPDVKEGIIVTITKNNRVFIDRQVVSRQEFDDAFAAYYATRRGAPVYLKADLEVAYGTVMAVIDGVKRSGVTNLGLVTEPLARR